MKIVLVFDTLYFVLSEEHPQCAGIARNKWDETDRMAKHKMVCAVDMICNLAKMFDE